MKISELMERLGEIQGEHGDLQVFLDEESLKLERVKESDSVKSVQVLSLQRHRLVAMVSNY